MKIDVEGSEAELLPDLLLSGALMNASKVFTEWHGYMMQTGRQS